MERAKDQRDVKCTIHPPIFANLVAEQPAGLVVEVWGGLTENTYLEWIIKHAAKFLRGVMLSEGGRTRFLPTPSLSEIDSIRAVAHPHIVFLYTSYTHQGYGYLILVPCFHLDHNNALAFPPKRAARRNQAVVPDHISIK